MITQYFKVVLEVVKDAVLVIPPEVERNVLNLAEINNSVCSGFRYVLEPYFWAEFYRLEEALEFQKAAIKALGVYAKHEQKQD